MIAAVLWIATTVGAIALELTARRGLFGSLSELGRRLRGSRSGLVLLFIAWSFVGWHLFSRYTIHPI